MAVLVITGLLAATMTKAQSQGGGTTPAASQPVAPATSGPAPRREPTAAEILKELTREENLAPRRAVLPTDPGRVEERVTPAADALPANAVAPPAIRLLPDGYRIVDRPGRLTRDGDIWLFSFESRSEGPPELPLRLLPNRLLEDMETVSAGGTNSTVFVVSGEVTEYRGRNYLLMQKMLVRTDLRNLK